MVLPYRGFRILNRVVHFSCRKENKLVPYKNPESKRQWEREHREQRNERRRMQRLAAGMNYSIADRVPDPFSNHQQPKSGWKVIIGLAVGFGVVLLAAFAGVSLPPSGSIGPSCGSNPAM